MKRLAHEIAERNTGAQNLVLIGVVRRGAALAERLLKALGEVGMANVPVGTLDISSYRDDKKGAPGDPRLIGRNIAFSLDGKRVILVDDVLYTGRTVRAALRRCRIWAAPNRSSWRCWSIAESARCRFARIYVGKNIPTPKGQRVYVRLSEVDGFDAVLIGEAR